MADLENEFNEDFIICPYCGEKHEDNFEDKCFQNEGEHEFECYECKKEFKVETEISVSYSTYKINN